jgi:hypothetical protein
MKTRSKLLKDAYPVLLFISLLMSWEFSSQGSPTNPGKHFARPWLEEVLRAEPICRLPLFTSGRPACLREPNRVLESRPFEKKLPWTPALNARSSKATADWEAL